MSKLVPTMPEQIAALADERDELLSRLERRTRALERSEFHENYATDAGRCIPGCPACEGLSDE